MKLFESIGFKLVMATAKDGKDPISMLQPPETDVSTEVGRLNRERLLRAWVEIGATLADFRRRFRACCTVISRLRFLITVTRFRTVIAICSVRAEGPCST